jgi:hypothetical protein
MPKARLFKGRWNSLHVELTEKKFARSREEKGSLKYGWSFERSIQSVAIAGGTPGTKCKRLPGMCRLARRNPMAT